MEDWRLLRDYAETGSETAFTSLVNRHLALVYSVAWRRLGDARAAEEVAQSVFCLLARKARSLPSETVLIGWLYRTTGFVAARHNRAEQRRRRRELEAASMSADPSATDDPWLHLAPHLDDAMASLDEGDRLALLLRFFQSRPFQEVGEALGVSEDAARMRVNRAIEKLRLLLDRKSITCTSAALATLLLDHAVEAVPIAAIQAVRLAALHAAKTAAVPSLLGGILAILAQAKLKTAAIALATIAAVTIALHLQQHGGQPSAQGLEAPRSQASAATGATPALPASDVVPEVPFPTVRGRTASTDPDTELTAREWYGRANAFRLDKRDDEALAAFGKSIELLNQGIGRWEWFTQAYFDRASLLRERKDYAGAIADYTKMLEFVPHRYEARANRANCLKYLKQFDQAIADYTTLLNDAETDFSHNIEPKEKLIAHTYEYRGWAFQDMKDYDNAIADYTSSLDVDPSGGEQMIVYWRRGWAYRKTQQIDRAIQDADALSSWALQWATSEARDSDSDKASTTARWGSEIVDNQRSYQLEVLAAVHARNGEFKKAISYQQRAIVVLTPDVESQRAAMQARLELYQSGQPLPSN